MKCTCGLHEPNLVSKRTTLRRCVSTHYTNSLITIAAGLIMRVHTGNKQKSRPIHKHIIYNTGPIQEIQQATEVMGKEDHMYFIIS